MAQGIRYKSYELNTQPDSLQLEFSGLIKVKQSAVEQVISDLTSFTPDLQLEAGDNSTLVVEQKGVELKILRDYVSKRMTVEPEGEELLEAPVRYPLVDMRQDTTFKQNLIEIVKIMLPPDPQKLESLKAKFLAEGGDLTKRILKNIETSTALENEISKQKRMDEMQLSIDDLRKAYEELEQKVAGLAPLMNHEKKVQQTLSQYGKLLQIDLDTESSKLSDEVRNIRHEELNEAAKAHKMLQGGDRKEVDVKQPRQASFVWVLGVVLFGLSVVGYLATRNILLPIIGLVAGLLEVGVWYLLNQIPSDVMLDVQSHKEKMIELKEDKRSKWQERLSFLERFFVDKAWVNAWREELSNIAKTIKGRLDGGDLQELERQKADLQAEIDKVETILKQNEGKDISPEDYLRKRRELDMTRIERSRLDTEFSSLPNFSQLNSILQEIQQILESSDPERVYGGEVGINIPDIGGDIVGINLENGQLKVKRKNQEAWEELNDPTLAGDLWLWLELDNWTADPFWPLIIINNPKLKANARISDRIGELQKLGQLIFINVLP